MTKHPVNTNTAAKPPFAQAAGAPVRLTARRERELARRIQEQSDPLARQELIEAALPMVYHIARRFEHGGMSREDLIAEGNLGLIQAVERFDPACGTRFQTYARWWIRESIHHAIARNGQIIRLPDYLSRRLRAWTHRTHEMLHEMQRPPADEEIRRAMGLSRRQEIGLRAGRNASALPPGEALLEFHPGAPNENSSRRRDQTIAHELLGRLDTPQRDVLELRYGLGEYDSIPRTVKQTAGMLEMTSQDVRRIEREALGTLRRIVRRWRTQSPAANENENT
ncbi:MAG: sigma-70 family RNA polymerase sigma factor [Phycisphaerae bacterium]|nr:sigma-70 family RNA polymerase sigma factor [Phycisphaerae bacterium]